MDRYEISEVNLGKKEYICFNLFEVWVLNFSLKEETMKNVYNQNVAELVTLAIKVLYCFVLLNGMVPKGYVNFP